MKKRNKGKQQQRKDAEEDQKPLIHFIGEVSVIWSSSTLSIEVKEGRVQPCPVRKSYFDCMHRSGPCPFRPTAVPLHLGIVIVGDALPLLTTAAALAPILPCSCSNTASNLTISSSASYYFCSR